MASFLITSAGESYDGATGNDTFEVITGASASTVNGFDGDDTVTLSASAITLGDSLFAMGEGDDTFDVNTANSTGIDYQSATVRGGAGEDTINIGMFSAEINNVSVNGNEGDDTINVNLTSIDGTASSITVIGGASADTITVTSDDDVHDAYIGGGQDDDVVRYLGGILSDSTLIGGFGEDTASAGVDLDSSLIQMGNGTNGDTDSADTLNYSGVMANSSIKGGAGGDTFTVELDDNSTAAVIEGNLGNDTISVSAAGDYESTEVRGGAGDDTITFSGEQAANVSSEIYGGAGEDNIDFALATGLIVYGNAGADDLDYMIHTGAGVIYAYDFGDSDEGSADQIEVGAADTGATVGIRIDDSDIAIKTAEEAAATVDGVSYELDFADGVVYFGDTGINDVTAAVDYMDGALGDDVAAMFSVATGEAGRGMSAGAEFYFFAKGNGDEADLLVELTDAGVATGGGGYVLTEANNFGNTDFTFTI
jgi:hypothetical protein